VQFEDRALDSLIAEALERNHDLRAAAARVEAAEALARIAGADLYPAADLSAEALRQRQVIVGLPIPGSDEVFGVRSTRYGVSLDVGWEIDLWGGLRARRSAALADVEAADEERRAVRLSLAAQTAKAWFAVLEAREQLDLAQATEESFRSSTDFVRRRFEAGTRPSLDLRLSLSNLDAAQSEVARRSEALDAAVRQLEILLGRYPAGEIRASEDLPSVPGPIPAGLPSDLLARRPDLLAAERRLAASTTRVTEARAALFPRLALTGSAGTASDDLEDLFDSDFGVWSIAGNLLQPLFEGGRLRGGVDLAQSVEREVLETYLQDVLRAFSEVESLLSAEPRLARREEELSSSAAHARASLVLTEDRYRTGLEDSFAVLEAQRRAFLADSARLDARRGRLDARVDLHLALGGDFEEEGAP
jgi:NodT family efflux transporter outer membrane factor (OMF) lipoprotein